MVNKVDYKKELEIELRWLDECRIWTARSADHATRNTTRSSALPERTQISTTNTRL